MRSDKTLALLRRENPVREDELPGPESDDGGALKGRIVLSDRTPPVRSRRLAFRTVALGAATAAIALGALSLLPGNGPSAVARAAAVLNPSDETILHTVVRTTPSDSTRSGTSETWQLNAPPYDHRNVVWRGNFLVEFGSVDGRPQAYDGRTNTIYTLPAGTELPTRARPVRDAGAERLDVRIRHLLASGEAHEDGRVTVEGRDAIRIVSSDSKLTLLVDARTYQPIEWRAVADDGTVETTRFQTYEQLPATAANLALLSMTAQHPGATVKPTLRIEGVGPVGSKRGR